MIDIDGSLDASVYGGKSAGLGRLAALGFRIPRSVAVDAYEEFNADAIWRHLQVYAPARGAQRGLAVRSSAATEDGPGESNAGRFLSLLGFYSPEELGKAMATVRAGTRDSGPIPVIVQVLVQPAIAGVGFSSDPIQWRRRSGRVGWTKQSGHGTTDGTERVFHIVEEELPLAPDVYRERLRELFGILSDLEDLESRPIDVEWAITELDELWMLQLRPLVLPPSLVIDLNADDAALKMPQVARLSSKVRLRTVAAELSIPMGGAIAVVSTADAPRVDLPAALRREDVEAVSTVLIYPERVGDEVRRSFVATSSLDVPFWVASCWRYELKRYPEFSEWQSAVRSLAALGHSSYWLSVVIAQEVLDFEYTGMLTKSSDGFLIEFAQGHFVPKGVVTCSTLVISADWVVQQYVERDQPTVYRIVNGHVVTEQVAELPKIDATEMSRAVSQLGELFARVSASTFEFGVTVKSGSYQVYLIDVADGDLRAPGRGVDLAASGVVSAGRCQGPAVRIENQDSAAIDEHLLSATKRAQVSPDGLVFCADRASVDLLPLARTLGANCGFIFREASVLSHLAIVLRELGIPAVVCREPRFWAGVSDGVTVAFDAAGSDLGEEDRAWLVDGGTGKPSTAIER